MARKKQNDEYNIDDEIIIGYNTNKNKDNPSKKSNKKKIKNFATRITDIKDNIKNTLLFVNCRRNNNISVHFTNI